MEALLRELSPFLRPHRSTSMFTSFGFMEGGKQNPRPVENRDLRRLGIERKAYMLSFVPDGLLDSACRLQALPLPISLHHSRHPPVRPAAPLYPCATVRSALLQWDGFVGLDDGDRPLVVREVGPDGVPLVHQPHAAAAAFADEIEAFAASAEDLDESASGSGATDYNAASAKSVRVSQPATDTPTSATGMTGTTPNLAPSALPLAAAPASVASSHAGYHRDHGDDEEKLDAPAAAPAPAPPLAGGPSSFPREAEPSIQALRPLGSSHDKGIGGAARAPQLLTPEFLLGAGRAPSQLPSPVRAQDPPLPTPVVSPAWPSADFPQPSVAFASSDDAREGPEGDILPLPAAGCYVDDDEEEEDEEEGKEEEEEEKGSLGPAACGPAAYDLHASHDVVDDDAPMVFVDGPKPATAEPLPPAASSAALGAPLSSGPRSFADADLMGAVLAAFASTAAQAAIAPAASETADLGPARTRVTSTPPSGFAPWPAAAAAPPVPLAASPAAAACSSGATAAAATAASGAPLPAPTIYDALSEMGPGNGVLCLAWGSRPHDTLVTELALKDAIAGQIADALTDASHQPVRVTRDDVWLVRPLRGPSGALAGGAPAPSDGDSVGASVLVRVPAPCATAASALADARESWFLVDLAAAEGAEYPCPVLFCDGFIPPEEEDSRA